jgi:uncharacterized repeat protein (TIGR04076 family)
MHKVKVKVIKKFSPEDVFGENHKIRTKSGKEITKCTWFKDDQEVIVENINEYPKDFPCLWAWRDMYKDIAVLYYGGDFNHQEEGVIYTSCSDGRKPVVFRLERMKEISR